MARASRRQHGVVVLGLHASSYRPKGVSRGQYWLGFFLSLGAAVLYRLVLPLVELTYKRAAGRGRVVTYALVVEMQLVMGFFATAFYTADTAPPSGSAMRLRRPAGSSGARQKPSDGGTFGHHFFLLEGIAMEPRVARLVKIWVYPATRRGLAVLPFCVFDPIHGQL
ncbi:hypothetical protein ACQ4PT_046628 [Festuca glaucescens]